MENINSVKERLKHLSKQLDEKESLIKQIDVSWEDYLNSNCETPKPIQRSVDNAMQIDKEYADQFAKEHKSAKISGAILAILGLALIVIPLVYALPTVLSGDLASSLVSIGFAAIPIIIGSSLFTSGYRNLKKARDISLGYKKAKDEALALDEENSTFNKVEYPVLLEKHQKEAEILQPRYIETRQQARDRLSVLIEQMEQEKPILVEKYHANIKEIITIIEDGRAQTLAEAINIMISDQNTKRLIAEQKKRTRIAQERAELEREQQEEAERHNRAMEQKAQEQIKLQQKQIKQQEQYSKCRNCAKEKYCTKTVCSGYKPK